MDSHPSISEFDALPRDEVLEPLAQCISRLSPTQKTILALYYHEDLEAAEIALCVKLTKGEVDQVRAETVGLLRTMSAAQIGPEQDRRHHNQYYWGKEIHQLGAPEYIASKVIPRAARPLVLNSSNTIVGLARVTAVQLNLPPV
jgi:hypothetical protein